MRRVRPVRVLLCGTHMKALWEKLAQDFEGQWFENVDAMLWDLSAWIHDGDRILVKFPHGTGLSKVVEVLIGAARKS